MTPEQISKHLSQFIKPEMKGLGVAKLKETFISGVTADQFSALQALKSLGRAGNTEARNLAQRYSNAFELNLQNALLNMLTPEQISKLNITQSSLNTENTTNSQAPKTPTPNQTPEETRNQTTNQSTPDKADKAQDSQKTTPAPDSTSQTKPNPTPINPDTKSQVPPKETVKLELYEYKFGENEIKNGTNSLEKGMKDSEKNKLIAKVQNQLNIELKDLEGYTQIEADGEFGDKTLVAVKKFQEKEGLEQDGKVGKTTWEKLFDDGTDEKKVSLTIPTVPKINNDTERINNTPYSFTETDILKNGEVLMFGMVDPKNGPNLISKAQKKLNINQTGIFDNETKQAIDKFKIDNNLSTNMASTINKNIWLALFPEIQMASKIDNKFDNSTDIIKMQNA